MCLCTFRAILLSILALLPLLGCTWILGLLFLVNSESEALAWIFTIVNSMQVSDIKGTIEYLKTHYDNFYTVDKIIVVV